MKGIYDWSKLKQIKSDYFRSDLSNLNFLNVYFSRDITNRLIYYFTWCNWANLVYIQSTPNDRASETWFIFPILLISC